MTSIHSHDARPIRLVTFDLYDTLIELKPRRWERLAAALEKLGIPSDLDALRAADRIAEDFYTEENAGQPIRDRTPELRERFRLEFMRRWLAAAGLPHDPDTVAAARRAYISEFETDPEGGNYVVFPDVLPALRRLRDAGIKRAVISNADADVTQLCIRLAFAHEMNVIVTSAIIGAEKPAPSVFRAAFLPLGVAAGECLHIGDQPRSDVVGALGVGMRAVLLDRYGRHAPGAYGVPIVRGLEELVDLVLAENG